MKKLNMFLTILITSLASLIVLTVIGFTTFTSTPQSTYQSSWMGDMWNSMGGMMGQSTGSVPAVTVQNPVPAYFGVVFVVLVRVTIFGVGGLAYFVAFPEIRTAKAAKWGDVVSQSSQNAVVAPVNAYEYVLKTLNTEERKIVEVLNAHNGKYLQKYIRKEAGLSRLKTHRIVARLAERGIVSLEKTGNTNQVFLENWLKQ